MKQRTSTKRNQADICDCSLLQETSASGWHNKEVRARVALFSCHVWLSVWTHVCVCLFGSYCFYFFSKNVCSIPQSIPMEMVLVKALRLLVTAFFLFCCFKRCKYLYVNVIAGQCTESLFICLKTFLFNVGVVIIYYFLLFAYISLQVGQI